MKVLVEAYGCSLNRGEAAELVSLLADAGFELTNAVRMVDIAVIFTCGVIEVTERKMLKRISELRKRCIILIICGCLGGMASLQIKKLAPDAMIFRAGEHGRVVTFLKRKRRSMNNKKSANVLQLGIDEGGAVAILPIATGCVGSCSYCATRLVRGPLQSRSIEEIISRVNVLIDAGAVELQMCCQDTATYGEDINSDLNELVSSIDALTGNFMLRIGMMNPKSAIRNQNSVFNAYEYDRVFKFLHLPVQAGSDEILTLMKRGYNVEDFILYVEKFRKKHRTGYISTDIIVGFPNETERDFKKSLDLIREIMPDIVNVTRFSARPRTPAYKMPGKVPGWVAKNRSRELTKIRFEISKRNNEAFEGKTVKALATEARRSGTTFLRTVDYRPVVVSKCIVMGKWYTVKITGSSKTHLLGKII